MARKKSAPQSETAAPQPATTPGAFVPPPPGVWAQPAAPAQPQPQLRVVSGDGAPTMGSPTPQPSPIRVEAVPGAERPTAKIHGYDEGVATYISRDAQLKSEQIALDEGKTWFREMARKFKKSHNLLTLLFASEKGSVEVSFSSTKTALKEPLLTQVKQSAALVSLLHEEEVLDPLDISTWILDNAYVLSPQGSTVTLRQAIGAGLTAKADKIVKLRKDYETVYQTLKGTLSPNDQALYEQLEAAGTVAPAVKSPR